MPAARPAHGVDSRNAAGIAADQPCREPAAFFKEIVLDRRACWLLEPPVTMQLMLNFAGRRIDPCSSGGDDDCCGSENRFERPSGRRGADIEFEADRQPIGEGGFGSFITLPESRDWWGEDHGHRSGCTFRGKRLGSLDYVIEALVDGNSWPILESPCTVGVVAKGAHGDQRVLLGMTEQGVDETLNLSAVGREGHRVAAHARSRRIALRAALRTCSGDQPRKAVANHTRASSPSVSRCTGIRKNVRK